MKKQLFAVFAMFFAVQAWAEVDVSSLPDKKKTPQGLYLTAEDAYDMVSKNPKGALFVDVRTRPEVEFVGMATVVDANIPYVTNDTAEWDDKKHRFLKVANSAFQNALKELMASKGLSKDDAIILMCRSGSRSAKAATLLSKLGYSKVYSVVDGFEGDKAKTGPKKGQRVVNGWKNASLPWSYKLAKEKMYLEL